jgi:hypothetical protein
MTYHENSKEEVDSQRRVVVGPLNQQDLHWTFLSGVTASPIRRYTIEERLFRVPMSSDSRLCPVLSSSAMMKDRDVMISSSKLIAIITDVLELVKDDDDDDDFFESTDSKEL